MGQASDPKLWASFPMGPTVREYLSIQPEEYTGEQTGTPDEERQKEFYLFMAQFLPQNSPYNQDQFESLLEEFTGMGYSSLAIQLAEAWPAFTVEESFRALAALGTALMMESEYDEAAQLLKAAQFMQPEETGPYNNLIEVYFAQERDDEALHWATEALKIAPNRIRTWEILAHIFYEKDKETAGGKLLELARQHESYAGLSLAAELLSPDDARLKAEYLADCYKSGERSAEFLVEYTAALGVARDFEKIPPIVWEAEKFSGVKLPWQLYAHAAQAYLALNQEEQANEVLDKIAKIPDFPKNIREELTTVYEQVVDENNTHNAPH